MPGSPPPPPARTTDTLPPLSTVVVPISVSASFLERTLDRVLDSIRPEPGLIYQHEGLDLGHGVSGTAQVWRRGATHVTMAGDAIGATLPVRIVLQPAWRPRLGPLSLPLDIRVPLDIRAEYTVHLQARPHLDANYNLRLNATFGFEVDRPVGIEAGGVGLMLTGASRRAAEEALSAVGDWLNSDDFHYLNFRDEAERGWQALQQPVTLSPGHHFRLAIEPAGVYAQRFRTQGETGILGLAVAAHIKAVATAEAAPPAVPLPGISPGNAPDGISLSLPLEASFASLEAGLQENVANHPWHIEQRQVVLRAAAVTGTDEGELQARIDISVTKESGGFDVEATLSAAGKPRLDIARQHLALEDFRYDVHTDSTLLNIAATLLRPVAGAMLQPWLDLPLEPQVARLLAEVNTRLASGIVLTDGVRLQGHIDGVRLTGLAVQAAGLAMTVETRGDLLVHVDRPD